MSKTSLCGLTRTTLAAMRRQTLRANYSSLERRAETSLRFVIRSSTVKRKSRTYLQNLNEVIRSEVVKHEQATMQEHYKAGRTRTATLRRIARLQRFERMARTGSPHSRPKYKQETRA